ncbi:MAG: hypothetical protein ABIP41_06995 [Croceibacterium sp.]
MVGVALGAFLLGAAAVWVMAGTPGVPTRFTHREITPSPSPTALSLASPAASGAAAEAHQAARQVAQVAQVQGGLDQRVAAMEQRITRLDLQAQAATGNASRAEGLLIAFAARRSIERGASLGFLEDQLRLRFGDARPNAVQAVIDDAKDPVTLDQLLVRLRELTPSVSKRPVGAGALTWLKDEMSRMFVVRREDSPSPAAANRIERARLFLQTGRADLAAAEVRRLPNAAAAQDWIADADRYAAAQRALDLLEMTAIQAPRELRDGAGRAVEQPGPA